METVTFKGNKEGITMVLDEHTEFETLCQDIVQKLWQARDFLGEHTNLVVNSKTRLLSEGEQLALKVLLNSLGHTVLRFVSQAPEPAVAEKQNVITEESAEAESKAKDEQAFLCSAEMLAAALGSEQHPLEMYLATGATLIIRKNIRSGQSLSYAGTLVILGDVNAGAELTAEGHIFILGTMRGIAHAGACGNSQAVVYATKLLPIQVRIADVIARAPDDEVTDTDGPEMARIIDNRVVIEPCQFN